MASSNIAGTLRRSLLIKVISKPAPSREDVASVIELTASKVVEALQAQSMTFYLVEGNEIAFKQIYYSPTLWAGDPAKKCTGTPVGYQVTLSTSLILDAIFKRG